MSQPSLVTVTLPICTLCLGGAGGYCYVPGCRFWMNEAPSKEVAECIREWAFIEIVAANKDAFPDDQD